MATSAPTPTTPPETSTVPETVATPEEPVATAPPSTEAPTPSAPRERIPLAGWQAQWPTTWGEETEFFTGWLLFTGTGSETFADNVSAEVLPSESISDDEMLASLEAVLQSVAVEGLEIIGTEVAVTDQGINVLSVRYQYLVAGELIQGHRFLYRGEDNALLVTLAATADTFAATAAELADALAALEYRP